MFKLKAIKPHLLFAYGLIFCSLVSIIYHLIYAQRIYWLGSCLIALFLIVLIIVRPLIFKFLHDYWIKLGFLLQRINTFLILGIIYFLMILPLGLLYRSNLIFRHFISRNNKPTSYWQLSEKKELNLNNQF